MGLDALLMPMVQRTFGGNPLATAVVSDILQPPGGGGGGLSRFANPGGGVKGQLVEGFQDAGRPDLAKMVRRPAFNTWIGQESGWRPGAVSPANNQGLANDGLFQVWRGHAYNRNGRVSRMSPYEQARLIAKHFPHLDPGDIRGYARDIHEGDYVGWG